MIVKKHQWSILFLQIAQLLYLPYIKKVPLFKGCSTEFINQIVIRLHEEYFLPGEVITEQGNVVDHLYFVCEGLLVRKIALCLCVYLCLFCMSHFVIFVASYRKLLLQEQMDQKRLWRYLGLTLLLEISPSFATSLNLSLLEFANYVIFYASINSLSRTSSRFIFTMDAKSWPILWRY